MKSNRPICMSYGCEKRARLLKNKYGELVWMFCSNRCAAEHAMSENALQRWCEKHQQWYHSDDQQCGECINEDREQYRQDISED